MATSQPIMKPARVDSTRELILSFFPPETHKNASLQQLTERVETFTRAGMRRTRLDALVNLCNWLRQPDSRIPDLKDSGAFPSLNSSEWRREHVWLCLLQSSVELRDRYLAGVASILEETDGVSLFAEAGMPSDRGLIPEAADRIFNVLLPAPREETELAKLFLRLFPTQAEVERFFSLPADQLLKVVALLVPVDIPEAWDKPVASLLDAFCLLGARVQGLGLSEKLRVRSSPRPVQQSPFYRLGRAGDTLVETLRTGQGTASAAQAWKAVVAECRAEMSAIVAHLDARGVNLDIVWDVVQRDLPALANVARAELALLRSRERAGHNRGDDLGIGL